MSDSRRYWDSSCFLGWLKKEEDKYLTCKGVIQKAEKDEILILTSAFTLVEVLYLNHEAKIPPKEASIVSKFFENEYIRTVALDRIIAEKAQSLVWDHNIKPKDAAHIATAIHLGLDIFDTFDDRLISRANGKIGNPPLRINKPDVEYQMEINDNSDK